MTTNHPFPERRSPHQSDWIENKLHNSEHVEYVITADPTEGAHSTNHRDTVLYWTAHLGPSAAALLVVLDDYARNHEGEQVNIHDLSAAIGNPLPAEVTMLDKAGSLAHIGNAIC